MSLVFNMVGGGGGGSIKDTDAILTVTVPTGATVTATKGALSLTPTMWVQAADPTLDCALFVIAPSLFDSQNAWTVTATDGTDSSSATVTISANKQYDVELDFSTGIYMHGEQYQQLTGGFEVVRVSSSSGSIAQVSYGTPPNGVISLSVSGTNANGAVCTVNPIDLTQFSTVTVKFESSFPNTDRLYVMANSSKTGITVNNSTNKHCDFLVDVGESLSGENVTLDISSANGLFYLLIGGFQAANLTYTCTVSEWYLR